MSAVDKLEQGLKTIIINIKMPGHYVPMNAIKVVEVTLVMSWTVIPYNKNTPIQIYWKFYQQKNTKL